MKIALPIFGIINLKKESGDYSWAGRIREYEFDKYLIDLDVHFKEDIGNDTLIQASKALENLELIHFSGKNALQNNFGNGGVVDEYIKEWKNDVFYQIFDIKEEFEDFIRNTDYSKSIEERLFDIIRIVRIGVYTKSENYFITLDFTFGYDSVFRDDMLIVTLNANFEVTDICTEG